MPDEVNLNRTVNLSKLSFFKLKMALRFICRINSLIRNQLGLGNQSCIFTKVPVQGRNLFHFYIRNPFKHHSCTLYYNSRYQSIIFKRFRYDEKILISAKINFILVMSFYISTCTRAKNIFHCLMYIIFSNIAHAHCNITEAYNSRYHRILCLECFRYDERNTHLCNNCNLICSLKRPYKEKLFHC